MLIAMHYVRTLCDKYFLSYYGFFSILREGQDIELMIHGVGVKWDPRRTAAYVPINFNGFEPHFLQCVS